MLGSQEQEEGTLSVVRLLDLLFWPPTHCSPVYPQLPSHPPRHKSRILCACQWAGILSITATHRAAIFSINFMEFQLFSQRTHVFLYKFRGIINLFLNACTCSLFTNFRQIFLHFIALFSIKYSGISSTFVSGVWTPMGQ